MNWRVAVLCACLLATGGYLARASTAEPTPIRQPLAELPFTLGAWRGMPNKEFSQDVLALLRVDDYITRSYRGPGGAELGLYVGYHATQRQGASIHSPLNCLPGAGWTPALLERPEVVVPSGDGTARSVRVNRVVIEKGLERQLVYYWYQSQGRVVASEYWGKFYSVVDAVRHNRTDGALVRVMLVVPGPSSDALAESDRKALDFVSTLFPLLSNYLPE
jgi:EpsI family protein